MSISTERGSANVLVVDDEPAMVGALSALLGQAGYRIIAAYDGEEALRRFGEERVDVVLLDLAMPGVDGAEVCRRLRAKSDVPIIVVSGERDKRAPVELLDSGADDYVRKPFRGEELLARIRAAMRHRGNERPRQAAGWEVDLRRHEIRWQGTVVPVTQIEFRLLRALVEWRGELVRHHLLLAAGWPDTPDPDLLWLKPHLARLRDKLAQVGAKAPVAVRGVGYRLEE
jgi:two-component system KDP operon response regulator KdpE